MQEELKLGEQAVTRHTQLPSLTYRLQLSPEILDPLCHGLGHAIYRLAFSMQHTTQSAPTADVPGGLIQRPHVSNLQPALGVITGRFAHSVSGAECSLVTHTQPADLCCHPACAYRACVLFAVRTSCSHFVDRLPNADDIMFC